MHDQSLRIGGVPATGFPSTSFDMVNQDDCGHSAAEIAATKHVIVTNPSAFDRACTWHTRNQIGSAVAGIGLVGAVVSLIMVVRQRGSAETTAVNRTHTHHDLAIVPVVTPDHSGASLSLTW
jgi:hypothetical protein